MFGVFQEPWLENDLIPWNYADAKSQELLVKVRAEEFCCLQRAPAPQFFSWGRVYMTEREIERILPGQSKGAQIGSLG